MAVVSPASITLNYDYDTSVIVNNKSFYSSDGVYFALCDFLSGAKDFATNQDNLLFLTDNFNLDDKLDDPFEIDKTQFITRSTISFLSGNTKMYLSAGPVGGNTVFTPILSSATIFGLDFATYSSTVSISSNNTYITVQGSNNLNLQTLRGDAATTQFFRYTLYNDQIVLFTSTGEVFTTANGTTLESTTYNPAGFASTELFNLDFFYYNSIKNKGDSNLAKYVSTPNNLTISRATSSLPYNYLISTPYKNLDTNANYININLAPLKNYYSPEGLQTPTLSTQLKNYNKIYTGLNTEDGYDKIYLSYKGSEITKVFTKDKDTYFHYPVSATNVALSASTLIEAGALAGSSPWRSDKVFVKKADYRKYSNWGDNPGPQNGVFFCSWLSAAAVSGRSPVWMDRYYNPNYINLTSVLTSTAFTSAGNNYPNVIWDIPSNQTFNPESLYIYHRVGDEDNQIVVNTLSSNLVIHIKDWTNPIINEVTQLSAGELYNYTASAVSVLPQTRDESLNTSISYGVVDFTNEDLNKNGLTLAFNAYNTDWGNIKGSQLVGNYYYGGLGVVKNNTLLTPFLTILNGNSLTTNTGLVSLKNTPSSFSNKNVILKGEYDTSYYVVTNSKQILVYDQDDLLISSTSFTLSGELLNAHLIEQQNTKQIIIFTKPTSTIVSWKKYNVDGTESTLGTVAGSGTGYNNYAIDLFGTPTYFNGASGNGTVDSNNIVFALSGNVLIRDIANNNSTAVLSALSAEYVACDHENNLWVLYANRNLCKLDNYGNPIWDVYLTDAEFNTNTVTYPRVINFISELDANSGNIIVSGLVVDPKTQRLFKINSENGTITKTASISALGNFGYNLGDGTGFDYQRKYVYTTENSNDISVKAYVRSITNISSSEQIVNLNHDVSSLTPGWHHFAVTLSPTNILTFYIDGLIAESTAVGSASSIYRIYNSKNNPDIIIGTASFKKQTLIDYTQESTDVYRFNGNIADVRVYDQALEQADIKALQKRFLLTSFSDLNWSCPTGNRYYIEQIERLFLHRLPGAKSNLFNIKIKNSGITNVALRSIIEKNIIASLSKTIPVHTKLNSIIWE